MDQQPQGFIATLWAAIREFFRSATREGMKQGFQDFADELNAELGAAQQTALPPVRPVVVLAPPAAKTATAPPANPKQLPAPLTTKAIAAPKPATEPKPTGTPSEEAPVKRGRGRPPKNPQEPLKLPPPLQPPNLPDL